MRNDPAGGDRGNTVVNGMVTYNDISVEMMRSCAYELKVEWKKVASKWGTGSYSDTCLKVSKNGSSPKMFGCIRPAPH